MIKNLFVIVLFNIPFLNYALDSNRQLYLDIMKKSILGLIYEDPSHQDKVFNLEQRENGTDWPLVAHSMIGLKGLNNIEFCIKDIIKNNIPGDFIETGVWRGGSVIFMRAILKVYNITNRNVWVADSFEGLPLTDTEKYPADKGLDCLHYATFLNISLDVVKNNFEKYNLLDNQVKFLKGWFKDTLPKAPIKKLALLRLDGDLYESTMDALKNLYSKVSIGGYIIIDDYHMYSCVKAIEDFRKIHNIVDELEIIDSARRYWKKTK